jgi:hypothetical protein
MMPKGIHATDWAYPEVGWVNLSRSFRKLNSTRLDGNLKSGFYIGRSRVLVVEEKEPNDPWRESNYGLSSRPLNNGMWTVSTPFARKLSNNLVISIIGNSNLWEGAGLASSVFNMLQQPVKTEPSTGHGKASSINVLSNIEAP